MGREPMGATRSYPEELDLNGRWSFTLLDRPEAVQAGHLAEHAASWAQVEVPGCWTMQGYDRPIYTNIQMPFPGPPPSVPEENPTGVYRRRVEVPAAMARQRILLEVGGADSVLYVFVNGEAVGMAKDSRLSSQFDLSRLVRAGEAFELAIVVVRWSDATYLEDQDHWHHAGIHRGVRLVATPRTHLADVGVVADYDPATGTGTAKVRAAVGCSGYLPKGFSVHASLAGAEATAEVPVEDPQDVLGNWLTFTGRAAELELAPGEVAAWSDELPTLHHLTVTLRDRAGDPVDRVELEVGFRRVEVVGHELLVNGQPVLIKGVNRHDHDARRGKAVTRASILEDLVLMKRHNLNAVRTSHYPSDPYLYECADRLGLYVVDEANLECHAYLRSLTKDPRWTTAILERISRMAIRDRNHPSVIAWSLGNESGWSPSIQSAYAWLKAFDPTRPVQYESGTGEAIFASFFADIPGTLAEPRPESDMTVPMYPRVEDIVAWSKVRRPDRPLIMCEYIHAMGNSGGGLDRYWEAIRATPGLQGGFAWDWADQALLQRMPDGSERLAYGGDFGDSPNDGAFCMNGLVAADRTPHPILLEMAAVLQPVRFEAVDPRGSAIRITNESCFRDLGWLQPSWSMTVDGEEVAAGELEAAPVAPGRSKVLRLPVPVPDLATGQVAHVELRLATTEANPWAEAGHVVARHQVEAGRAAGPATAPGAPPEAGTRLEQLSPRLQLFRAPIDNETFAPPVGEKHAERFARLELTSAHERLALKTATELARSGGTWVSHEVVVPEGYDDLPRVGVRLELPSGVRAVEWFGGGPHECYPDRRASAISGRYLTTVDEWPVAYVHPSHSGNRVGVRWLRFLDADGRCLLVVDGLDDANVNVSRYTEEELDGVSHLEELPASDRCYLWIDAVQRGVGSAAVGPEPEDRFRPGPGTYRWAYRLR